MPVPDVCISFSKVQFSNSREPEISASLNETLFLNTQFINFIENPIIVDSNSTSSSNVTHFIESIHSSPVRVLFENSNLSENVLTT